MDHAHILHVTFWNTVYPQLLELVEQYGHLVGRPPVEILLYGVVIKIILL